MFLFQLRVAFLATAAAAASHFAHIEIYASDLNSHIAHLSNFWAPELYISVPKLSDVTFTSAPACGCRSIHKTRQEIGLYYSYRLSVGRSVGVRLSATFGNLKFTCNAICLEFQLKTILLLIFVDCCAQNLTISVEKFVLRGRYFRGLS